MATNYSRLKKQLEELKYNDPNVTVVEDEKGNKVNKSIKPNMSTNISPVKKTNGIHNVKPSEKNTWFQSGAFSDGYQFGDISKTGGATILDAGTGVLKGIFNMTEGVVDLGRYGIAGVADLLGADEYAEGVRERANQNTTNILFNGIQNVIDKDSILGEKSDNITEGLGYVAGLYGTAGLGKLGGLGSKGGRLLTTGATFSSSMGSEMSNAYNSGATDTEAVISGLISGSVEALTENMFGGLGKTIGKGALDDVVAGTLTKKIKNQTAKSLTQAGIKAMGEGFEEVVSNVGQNIGRYLTYDTANENNLINKEFMSKLEDGYDFGDLSKASFDTIFNEENLDNFITGMVVSSIAQAPSVKNSIDTKRDFITGYTQNEQSIIDKEVENRIKEVETEGKKLSTREKTKIKEQVENDLQKGYISTDTIESTFGGEEYNTYKTTLDKKTAIENEIKELENKNFAELKVSEKERLDSLREELKTIDTNTLKSNLESSMAGKIANDGYLQRSYQEKANKSVKFEADVTKYDAKQQEVIQKAIDSGILNNTNKTHEFVDMVAKISADKGVSFDFANNAKLKESGFAIDGKQVNGLVNENGITVNIDSSNALNKVVGHEITHVLEGTEFYTELQQAVKEYATTKGEYQTRLDSLTELYKDVDNANIENELTSDLVGEYLFTDTDFVNNLSTTKPNVFQKIYNEIKYLLKVATAGSKEARQLEKVKKTFEEAYRNSQSNVEGTKLSISERTDGSKFIHVDTDQHIFDGLKTNAEYRKVAKNYINTYLKGETQLSDNDTVSITRQGANKYTNPSSRQSNYIEKMKLSPELKNVLEIAQLEKTSEASKETSKFPKWEYYRFDFEIEGKEFTGVINIGVDENGGKHFYEVNKIHEKNTNGISAQSQNWHVGASDNTISNNDTSVNNSISESTKSDTKYSLSEDIDNYMNKNKFAFNDNGSITFESLTNKQINSLVSIYRKTGYEDVSSDYLKEALTRKGVRIPREVADVFIEKELGYKPKIDTTKVFEDAEGNKLTKEQVEFYKDSGVRDIRGRLIPVYHRTDAEFTIFDSKAGTQHGKKYGSGFYFSINPENYGNNTMKLYLNAPEGEFKYVQKMGYYIVQNPNQIKNVDNTNPTSDPDIRYSLGEDTAPKQSNLTYGEDVALQISPLQEEISKVVEEVQQMREQIDKMVAPMPEYRNNTYEDLEALEQQYNKNFENMDTENVPEGIDDNSNFFLSEETDMVESEKQVKGVIRNTLGLNTKQTSDVYKSIVAIEDFDIDDVKNAIEEYSQFITSDNDTNLQDLKKAIRTTKLDISYLKATDSNFKDSVKNAFGTMRLANSGQAIDSFYNEMSSMYPDLLPSNIDNEADQFQRLLEVSKMDHVTKYTEAIPEETMNEYANEIYKTIKNYQDNLAIQNSNKDFFNAVRKGEIIAPVENTVENVRETVEETPLSGKQVKVDPKLAPTSMEAIERSQATINNEPSRVEQQVAQILDEKPTKKFDNKRLKAVAVANIVDKGYYISKLARKTNNRQLDALWDNTLLSNTQAQEVIGEGRFKLNEDTKTYEKVGDSVYEIFEGLENTNKVKDFNEYMYHKLNIERMSLEDNALAKMKNLKETTLKTYTNEEINKMARMQLKEDADQSIKEVVEASKEYKNLSKVKNKPVFGFSVDANASIDIVNRLEENNPEFSDYAKRVYEYESGTYGDLAVLVESGILSQEDANYYKNKYESYVPIMRDMEATMLEGQMFGKRVSVGNAVKSATGGSQDIIPLKDAMAIKTMLVQRSANMNKLGLELMHTLNPVTETETVTAENIIDDLTNNKDIVQAGTNGKAPTMTVYEHGVKHTFEIPVEIYEALKTNYDSFSKATFKPANAFSNFKRGVLTQYNPFFMVTNMIKDSQDILINSQHPASTYASIPEAIAQLTSKGYWYKEMQTQGLFQDTYYDNQQGFDTTKKGLSKITEFYPLRKISEINDFIERVPRMAEYIASRKAGASVEVASLDASRVTTNFKAGGDWTKFLNRNGFTFLNASVQGATQQVRNFQEAHQQGLKGYMKLATKFVVATLPAVLLNNLLWDDDEEYEELSDYIKDNYYIIGKYGDGQYIRIPKGRMTAVIQDGFEQMTNLVTGDDEVDLKNFLNLVTTNLAPSNPIENNILSPFLNTKLFSKDDPGKTWYGSDLVPTRLQDKPIAEQYDESTDELSKWLGEKLNLSPIKINNLIDQNTGVIGDLLLPMMTAEAKTKNSNPIMAGIEDKFTADVVFDNKYSTDFYSVKEELARNSNGYDATDEDILKTKYMNSKQSQMNDIYAEIRDVQNSSLDKETKYAQVRDLRKQLNDIAETSLNSYEDIDMGSNYAKVGEIEFRKNTSGEWEKINAKQLEKQNAVTSTLGVSPDDYWNNKDEYDYAYENPSKYATATAIADYKTYKTYTDALNDISADKDSDGKSISGSRKQKVFDYVNNLDLDFEQKVMLAKLEYPSYDEYNYEIVDYLNNRNDINYDEMVSILTELGFKVDANGNVSWD